MKKDASRALSQCMLELHQDAGLTFSEISKLMGYSLGQVAGRIKYVREGGYGPTQRKPNYTLMVGTWVTSEVAEKLATISREWNCTTSELIRTFIVCGIEDYESDDGGEG